MMYSVTFLVVLLQTNYQITEARSIQLYKNIDNNGNIQFRCSYSIINGDSIDSVSLYANKFPNDTFQSITLFKPSKMATVTTHGQYLSNRITLTNFTELSNEVSMTFINFTCKDERKYYCWMMVTDSGYVQLTITSNVYSLVAEVFPTKPDIVFFLDSEAIVEGKQFTLLCQGNVGKPAGKYLWQKIRNNKSTYLYENITTAVTEVPYPDPCGTYNGTSNLTIEATAEDNLAIVRCFEKSLNGSEQMYAQSLPVNVLYKVRNTRITKHPNKDFYLVGSDRIELICNADGNPHCNYTWYKENSITEILSNGSSLIIGPVNITSNGTYICEAVNEFNGNVYKQNQTVNIYIVYVKPVTSTVLVSTPEQNTDTDVAEQSKILIVVLVLFAAVVLVTVLVCSFKRKRCRKKQMRTNTYSTPKRRSVDMNNPPLLNTFVHPSEKRVNQGYDNRGFDTNDQVNENQRSKYTDKDKEKSGSSINTINNPETTYVNSDVKKNSEISDTTENRTQGLSGNNNDSRVDEDDQYADSQEGMYDHTRNRRHKEKTDGELYEV